MNTSQATTNGTEIILVADEYGNQESNDTTEDDGTATTTKRCRFLKKSASGDGKGWHGFIPIWISARLESQIYILLRVVDSFFTNLLGLTEKIDATKI